MKASIFPAFVLCVAVGGAEAASLSYLSHTKVLTATTYNTHYLPGFGIDTAGALPGADDTLVTSSPDTTLFIVEKLEYGPDIFGRENQGAMTAVGTGTGDADGHIVSFALNPTIAGEAAPQVTLGGESLTRFTVDQDTEAAIMASFSGSIATTVDQVGAVLIEYDPVTGQRTSTPFILANFATGVDTTGSGGKGVTLRADRIYELVVEANARANVPTEFADNQRSSDIIVAIAPTQALTETDEVDALKPNSSVTNAVTGTTHIFALDEGFAAAGSTTWLDPVIATGFAYEITGASVAALSMPSLDRLFDPDGYEIWLDGSLLAQVAAGGRYVFDAAVTAFELRGIDPRLGLDPENPGFVLGLDFVNAAGGAIGVRQTALTIETDVAAVPLPAGAVLLLSALGAGLVARRRPRWAAA